MTCKHRWILEKPTNIVCLKCRKTEIFEGGNIRTLSEGIGVQTCYLLLNFPERYDVIIHADVANGDREHGEHDITYWILDNIVEPFCKKHDLPLWIVSHPRGSIYDRSLDQNIIPMMKPRWCTQDHKVDVMTKTIRKGLEANFPDNVVISDIGFSIDESTRMDNSGSNVKYNLLDYPLIEKKITRNECVQWLNENYPIIMNGNKIDWKDCKSGCWFCPFTPVKKLRKLPLHRQKEMIHMEENSTSRNKFKGKPLKVLLGSDLARLTDWTDEDDITDEMICDSGHCFV